MSSKTNADSFYFSSAHVSGKCEPEVEQALRDHDNNFLSLKQSIASINSQLATTTSTSTSTTSGTASTSNSSTTTGGSTSTTTITNIASTILGFVNDQTGQTAYSTLQADYGKCIVLDDASAVAVTLSTSGLTTPWYADFLNLGAGTATLTPGSGVISYAGHIGAASMPITQGYFATVYYDGANFWAELAPIVPKTIVAVAHKWLNSYDATTGLFTQTQPAFTDISGIAAPAQLPTPTGSTLGGVEAAGPITSEWINEIDTSGVPHLSQPAFTDISGIAAVAQGGTGTATPSLVAGTNVTITGSWPDQTVSASGSGSGTITGVTAGTGLTGGGTSGNVTLALANTGVTAGSYTNTNLTVNAEGQITAATNGSASGSYPVVVSSALSTTSYTGSYSWTSSGLVSGAAYRLTVFVTAESSGTGTATGTFQFTDSIATFDNASIVSVSVSGNVGIDSGTYTFYTASSDALTVSFTKTGTITYIPQAIVLERLG